MKLLKIKLFVVAVIMFAATSAFADYSYNFNVDTSSISGTSGFIELQFNPGSIIAPASAAITNFTTNAVLGAAQLSGAVTGALPSLVTINNTTGFNDYFQQITFGNSVNFALNLSGAAGSSFGLSFWQDIDTPVLTTDPNGFATTIDVNPNGAVVTNNSGVVTANATPIPAAAWLLGSGLMGLVGIRRKMKI